MYNECKQVIWRYDKPLSKWKREAHGYQNQNGVILHEQNNCISKGYETECN